MLLMFELAVPNSILHRRDGLICFAHEKCILNAIFLRRLYSPVRAGALFYFSLLWQWV